MVQFRQGKVDGLYFARYRRVFGFVLSYKTTSHGDGRVTYERGVRIGKRKFSVSKTRRKVSETTTD